VNGGIVRNPLIIIIIPARYAGLFKKYIMISIKRLRVRYKENRHKNHCYSAHSSFATWIRKPLSSSVPSGIGWA
jgi:hypothetical protein